MKTIIRAGAGSCQLRGIRNRGTKDTEEEGGA